MDTLALVLPCYNEEEVLELTIRKLRVLLTDLIQKGKVSQNSYMIFINDGSKDTTWEIIKQNHLQYKYVNGIKLAGNVGHQNALWSGIMTAKETADIIVTIDADLQDDINLIECMIDKYHSGKEIVYGIKKKRKADPFIKRVSAKGFYKLMNILGVKTIYNHADFRLMGKASVEALSQFKERNLFLRGIIPMLGFEADYIYEEIKERPAGKSKYSLKKMLYLALNGITSFSIKPLTIIGLLGALIVLLCLILIVQAFISHLLGKTVTGWTSIVISIWFVSGVHLISLGIIGEYIGKLYIEVKERPIYIVEESLIHKYEEL